MNKKDPRVRKDERIKKKEKKKTIQVIGACRISIVTYRILSYQTRGKTETETETKTQNEELHVRKQTHNRQHRSIDRTGKREGNV